jgi:hypothetical protein
MERHELGSPLTEEMAPELRQLLARLGERTIAHLGDARGIVQGVAALNLDQLRAFEVVERGKFHGGGSLIGRSMRLEILRSGASRQTRSRRGT